MDSTEISREIRELAGATCVELMQAYGVVASTTAEAWEPTQEAMLAGVMGFVSEHLVGSCLLAGGRDVLMASAPKDARPRDWVGELANQLVGRLKAKLLSRGVTITLNTPVVLSGISLVPLPRTEAMPTVLRTSLGRMLLGLEVDVDPGFSWGTPEDLPAAEGDVVVF